MPRKLGTKHAQKRVKNPGKIRDLPAKSVESRDADEVKGGYIKIDKARR